MRKCTLAFALLGLTACDRNPGDEAPSSATVPAAESAPLDSPRVATDRTSKGSAGTPPPAPSAPSVPPEQRAAEASAGGLTWRAGAPFTRSASTSPMRAAEYRVTRGDASADLTVFHFPGQGGSVDANLDRWIGQFTIGARAATRDDARIEKHTINGLEVTTLAVDGGFAPGAMPGMPAQPPIADARMLAAIAVGPVGPVFFKLTGPKAVVNDAEPAFDALVGSLRPN